MIDAQFDPFKPNIFHNDYKSGIISSIVFKTMVGCFVMVKYMQ